MMVINVAVYLAVGIVVVIYWHEDHSFYSALDYFLQAIIKSYFIVIVRTYRLMVSKNNSTGYGKRR